MRLQRGFTLIELMIVVLIIGILAAVAVPAYGNYVKRSKIANATSVLSAMRVSMEQYFQDNRTYVGACVTGTVAPLPSPGSNQDFSFACSNLGALTYTITATGTSNPMTNFVYTINQANTRATTSTGTWGKSSTTCWVSKDDGSC